jgi:hypothetical protein
MNTSALECCPKRGFGKNGQYFQRVQAVAVLVTAIAEFGPKKGVAFRE